LSVPDNTTVTLTVLLAVRPSGAETSTKNVYMVLNVIVLASRVNALVVIVVALPNSPQSVPKLFKDPIVHVHWWIQERVKVKMILMDNIRWFLVVSNEVIQGTESQSKY
jgi:hypothetical protein